MAQKNQQLPDDFPKYPLVAKHHYGNINMEHRHFEWENSLFQWSCSSSQSVNVIARGYIDPPMLDVGSPQSFSKQVGDQPEDLLPPATARWC